jgi:hypothetical protein
VCGASLVLMGGLYGSSEENIGPAAIARPDSVSGDESTMGGVTAEGDGERAVARSPSYPSWH